MNEFLTLFVLAVGLSMDAFAVAVCKGLAMKKMSWKNAAIVGAWFGGFQALMPAIGYFLGVSFAEGDRSLDCVCTPGSDRRQYASRGILQGGGRDERGSRCKNHVNYGGCDQH